MLSMAAETGKFVSAKAHYDLLISEGDDPVLDPPELSAYMDGWDGEAFLNALELTPDCRVLEIGVGTGRLALRVLKRGCAGFTGLDLSEAALRAASRHLAGFADVSFVQGEFPKDAPGRLFDRIYSSLTFLHIEDKRAACERIASLLAPAGRCVISLDKERSDVLDMGVRRVKTFPDTPEEISLLLQKSGLQVLSVIELERAYLVIAKKGSLAQRKLSAEQTEGLFGKC